VVAGGVGVVVAGGFGVAALGIFTPLFQTNFEPDLMQVNFFAPTICVAFNLVHLAPALAVAAFACIGTSKVAIKVRTDTEIAAFLMPR
jgi:hypothetical protein